jgi:hypothetical protein
MQLIVLKTLGDDPVGATIDRSEPRAERLIRTGYAKAAPVKKKGRDRDRAK